MKPNLGHKLALILFKGPKAETRNSDTKHQVEMGLKKHQT